MILNVKRHFPYNKCVNGNFFSLPGQAREKKKRLNQQFFIHKMEEGHCECYMAVRAKLKLFTVDKFYMGALVVVVVVAA